MASTNGVGPSFGNGVGSSPGMVGANSLQQTVDSLDQTVNHLSGVIGQLANSATSMNGSRPVTGATSVKSGGTGGNQPVYSNNIMGAGGAFNGGVNNFSSLAGNLATGIGGSMLNNAINLKASQANGFMSFSDYMSGSTALAMAQQAYYGKISPSAVRNTFGSWNAQDAASMIYSAQTGSGYNVGSAGFNSFLKQGSILANLNPAWTGTQGAEVYKSFGSMQTNNALSSLGISTYSSGKQRGAGDIALQFMKATNTYTRPGEGKYIKGALGQNSNFMATLNSAAAQGLIDPNQVEAIASAAQAIMESTSKGMTNKQALSSLSRTSQKSQGSMATQIKRAAGNQTGMLEGNLDEFSQNFADFNQQISRASDNFDTPGYGFNSVLKNSTALLQGAGNVADTLTTQFKQLANSVASTLGWKAPYSGTGSAAGMVSGALHSGASNFAGASGITGPVGSTSGNYPGTKFGITSPFGANDTGIRSGAHTGVDYAFPSNTPVHAERGGKVSGVGHNDPAYGNYVFINSGKGYRELYGHLNKVSVTNGSRIGRGALIGLSGATGNVTGPHLHYEVDHLQHGQWVPVNPATTKYDKGAWSIPRDQNAVVHKDEMIIPANEARQIRNVLLQNAGVSGRNSGGGGIIFQKGSIHVDAHGGADGSVIANEIVDALSKNERFKKLQEGIRN